MKRGRDDNGDYNDGNDIKLHLSEADEVEAKRLMRIAEEAERRAEERLKQKKRDFAPIWTYGSAVGLARFILV